MMSSMMALLLAAACVGAPVTVWAVPASEGGVSVETLQANATGTAGAEGPGLIVSAVTGESTKQMVLEFADHGSGARQDLSVWGMSSATYKAGWKIVGHVAQSGYGAPSEGLLAVRAGADTKSLAAPTGLTLNWGWAAGWPTSETEYRGAFYTPICPSGYGGLGSVATNKATDTTKVSDFPNLVCVSEKYLNPKRTTKLTEVWTNKPGKEKQDGSAWKQPPFVAEGKTLAMPFVAGSSSSYSAPTSPLYSLNPSQVQVVEMPTPPPPPPAPLVPEQVHLALGFTVDTMAVSWSTVSSMSSVAKVQWGSSPTALTKVASGNSRVFTSDPDRTWYTHAANITGLTPGGTYYYKVGNMNTTTVWSEVFSFRAATDSKPKPGEPELHLIYGDMGSSHAYSLCPDCGSATVCNCTNKTLGVVSETSAQMILHLGDFAYNFNDDKGVMGDIFMRNIEPIAAQVPYMVSVGNHENSPEALAQYTERFRHVPSNSGTIASTNGISENNWWYSWDAGLVHYVAISTELYFGINSVGDTNSCAKQFAFLKADLAKANKNRDKVPWIAVHGHRSVYCSCDGDCDGSATTVRNGTSSCGGLEELFFEQGVDLFLNGHEHDYERMWPTYQDKTDMSNIDPKATIYIVTGAAGCSEMHEPFTKPQPPRSAFRSNTFGYSRMYIHNASHIHWQQVVTDPTYFGSDMYGKVIDDTWFIQHNHGPFSRDEAPSSVPLCSKHDVSPGIPSVGGCGEQFDHWAGREDDAGMVEVAPGSIWKRLQHDRPVPIAPEEDAELLAVFNAWEKAKQNGSNVDSNAAIAREIRREESTWEDLSDAR